MNKNGLDRYNFNRFLDNCKWDGDRNTPLEAYIYYLRKIRNSLIREFKDPNDKYILYLDDKLSKMIYKRDKSWLINNMNSDDFEKIIRKNNLKIVIHSNPQESNVIEVKVILTNFGKLIKDNSFDIIIENNQVLFVYNSSKRGKKYIKGKYHIHALEGYGFKLKFLDYVQLVSCICNQFN